MRNRLLRLRFTIIFICLAAVLGFVVVKVATNTKESYVAKNTLIGVVQNLTGTLYFQAGGQPYTGLIAVHDGGLTVGIRGGGSDGNGANNGAGAYGSKWYSNAAFRTYLQPAWSGTYPDHFMITADITNTSNNEGTVLLVGLGYDVNTHIAPILYGFGLSNVSGVHIMAINTKNTVPFTTIDQHIANVFVGGAGSVNGTLTARAFRDGIRKSQPHTVHLGFEKTGTNLYTLRYFWEDDPIPAYTIRNVAISSAQIFDNRLALALSNQTNNTVGTVSNITAYSVPAGFWDETPDGNDVPPPCESANNPPSLPAGSGVSTSSQFPTVANETITWSNSFQRVVMTENSPRLFINGVERDVDVALVSPYVFDCVLYVPMTAAKRAMGSAVAWQENGTSITATFNSKSHTVTGVTHHGVLFIPLRTLADAIGYTTIGWDNESGTLVVVAGADVNQDILTENAQMSNQAEQWFGSDESIRLADNLLLFQRSSGGWQGSANFTGVFVSQIQKDFILTQKDNIDASLDNGATIPEIRYLIRLYQATRIERFKTGYMLGLNAVLNSQYSNGGLTQALYRPATTGFSGEITHNDDVMINVLYFWRDIIRTPASFWSIDGSTVAQIKTSLTKGIQNILDSQIYSNGQQMLTAWAGKHERTTLVPTWARDFEPPSIMSYESIMVARFLMAIDTLYQDRTIISQTMQTGIENAVHAAVAFLAHVEILGYLHQPSTGINKALVPSPGAKGLWARFIDIETFDPLFVDRRSPSLISSEQGAYGSVVTIGFLESFAHSPVGGGNLRNKYNPDSTINLPASYANLSAERRGGYSYIGSWGTSLPTLYTSWLNRNGLTPPTPPGPGQTPEEGDVEIVVKANDVLAITTDAVNGELLLDIMPTPSGTLAKQDLTVTVSTNSPSGYTLNMNSLTTNTTMVHETIPTFNIPSTTNPYNSPATLAPNTWGWNLGAASSVSTFSKIPPSDDSQTIRTTSDSDNKADPSIANTLVTFGANINSTMATGTYTNTIVFTATSNYVPPGFYITSISPSTNWTGGEIYITGADFDNIEGDLGSGLSSTGNGITVGGIPCLSYRRISSTSASCVLPPQPTGTGPTYPVVMNSTTLGQSNSNRRVTYDSSSKGNMQDFSSSTCAAMPMGLAQIWTDARNNAVYRIKKMLDNKCWMIDNLAYGGGTSNGGSDFYGDTHTLTFATACGSTNWNSPAPTVTNCSAASTWIASTSTKWITTNNNNPTPLADRVGNIIPNTQASYNDTTPIPCTNTPTGTSVEMMSECLSYLYHWCAAVGLDSGTTPTCGSVAESTTGNSMASTGIVGKPGGVGGESKGNNAAANQAGVATTNGTICPAGWRLPVGRVGASPNHTDTYNEFAILNSAMYTNGQNLTPDVTQGGNRFLNWRPAGSFSGIGSGYRATGTGLTTPSSVGRYWSSSLESSANASHMYLSNTTINPSIVGSSKQMGMAVRCVLN